MRAQLAGTALAATLLVAPAGGAEDTESTCLSCHAEEEDPDLSTPVEEWGRSVHAEAEVSCDACHGGDPFEEDEELSMDEESGGFLGAPGWWEVPEFCGACHEEILEAYRRSVMGTQIAEGEKVAVCTTCHMTDGHAIPHAAPREILTEERCGECHDAARALLLRDLLEGINFQTTRAGADLDAIRQLIDISALDHELDEVLQRSTVIAHTYDADDITQFSIIAGERLDALTDATRERAEEATFRRRLGLGATALLLATCVGIIRLERDLRRRSLR